MADSEAKARAKLEEAEKKSRKSGGGLLGFFGGGGSNVTDACEAFNQVSAFNCQFFDFCERKRLR